MTQRLAALAAILGLSVTSAVYLVASKSVVLVVDGRAQHLATMHKNVGDLLAHQQLELTSYDLVLPSTSAQLHDGQRITVDFARPVHLNIDGTVTTTWTTARTVGAALEQARIAKVAWISQPATTAIDRAGIELDVRLPKKVSITMNKKSRIVTTTAANVDQLLLENKISLSKMDRAIPGLTTKISRGMKIRIVDVYQKTVTKVESVKFEQKRIPDKTMLEGKRLTKVRGANGRSQITYRLTFADGKLESKKAIKTIVLAAPKAGVIVYGTKKRTLEQLNWTALAWCESRNHPTSVSRNKLYYGLYQFSLTAWKSVGGSGKPSEASREEQLIRAKLLYQKRGKTPWPHCGRLLWS